MSRKDLRGHEGHTYEDGVLSEDYDPEFVEAMERTLSGADLEAREEGRKLGLKQAETHLRKEAARLRKLQDANFLGSRVPLIDKLSRLARELARLK